VRVDVIIDNFNYAQYLGAAIDSALAQTYHDTKVIVVDDGSTDSSRDVIDRYGNAIVPVLKENGGQASAFNVGLERSDGDVVLFLDADDMLLPQATGRIAAAFAAQPELAKVHFRMEVVDGDGRRTGGVKPPAHIRLPSGDLREATARYAFDLARPPTSGNAFAARVLQAIMPLPVLSPTAADWYIVYAAGLFGPVAAIDEPMALYRVHSANWYEPALSSIDLDHVRGTVIRMDRARKHMEVVADRLGMTVEPGDAAMCEIAWRAISLKLDAARHPIASDTIPGLLAGGVHSARRRFDVNGLMKVAFVTWLACFVVAPRRFASWPAEVFMFPDRRPALNLLLSRLHRTE
jgi:hypothetical protein